MVHLTRCTCKTMLLFAIVPIQTYTLKGHVSFVHCKITVSMAVLMSMAVLTSGEDDFTFIGKHAISVVHKSTTLDQWRKFCTVDYVQSTG